MRQKKNFLSFFVCFVSFVVKFFLSYLRATVSPW